MQGKVAIMAMVSAVLIGAAPAGFADQASDSAQVLARAQALLKQVGAQKQQLEIELAKVQADTAIKLHKSDQQIAKLKQDIKDKTATLEEAQKSLTASTRHGAALDRDLGRTKARLKQTEDRLREVIGKYRELAANLQKTKVDKSDLEHRLAQETRRREDAEAKNEKLYQLNAELVKKFDDKGVMDALLQHEPFTGIKEVQIENIKQDYSYKADQQKVRVSIDGRP